MNVIRKQEYNMLTQEITKEQHLIVSKWIKRYQTVDIYQDVIKIDSQFVIWSTNHKRELGKRHDKTERCEQTLKNLGYCKIVK